VSQQQKDTTGALNGWHCPECGRVTLVVQVHHGVTPMFLACRYPDCEGTGSSLMYPWERMGTFRRDGDDRLPARVAEQVEWEWYRPTGAALERMNREMRQHVQQGGLDIRPITDAGRRLLAGRTRP
jgi:ssDNA-binding Zn-finger/Zn-ribbon topoisomerase 1